MATTNTSSQSSVGDGSALFSRNATGLVKLGSPYRLLVMNIVNIGLTYTAFYFWLGPANFPSASLPLAILVTLPFGLAFMLTYALMAVAVPRSGGEYLWISRAIHPSLGFGVSMLGLFANGFFLGIGGYWLATLVVGPVLSVVGVTEHSSTLVTWGARLQETGLPSWSWGFGLFFALATWGLLAFGMKVYYRFQQIAWYVGLACLGLGVAFMLFGSDSDFVSKFNEYAAATGGPRNATHAVLEAGAARPHGTSVFDLFGLFALVSYSGVVAAYLGGEVRNPRRSQLIASGAGCFVYMAVVLILVGAIAATPGLEFNNSAAWLSINDPDVLGGASSPTFMLWMTLLAQSNVVALICVTVGIVIMSANWFPTAALMPSRAIFAWGFDRLVPSRAAAVSDRTGGPTVAVGVVVVFAIVMLTLYSAGEMRYAAPYFGQCVMFFLVSLIAIIFPFTRGSRGLFVGSAADIRIGRVPLLTILAAVSSVFYAVALYYMLKVDGLGFNTTGNLVATAIAFVVPIPLYFAIRAWRESQGISLDAATRVLPPE